MRTEDLPPDELIELVRQAQSGDLAAFNGLVVHYQRRIYNVCFRTMGNAEDAADATQDAFLSAYRNLATFRGPLEGFHAWLVRIAVNACYDLLRKQKRRPADSLERLQDLRQEDAERGAFAPDPSPGPEQRAMDSETARRIQDGLGKLSPEQRMTVVLCDIQGLTYDEVARALGVELGTVKSRLSRARVALRDFLAQKGELPASTRRLE
jgi:RNA polymerase sigma-70 factor (ECF subfamily)